MQNSIKHIGLLFSLIFYTSLCFLLHPLLGYLLDSDGVAYLTIAKRVAQSQYVQSINGLWSPLNSWLLVPFIHRGIDPWLLSKIMNSCFGGCVIVLSHFLFLRFNIKRSIHIGLLFALSIVMVHNVYLQMFGDVLQLIFVLSYLLILLSRNFLSSYWKTVICGIIMGIGFYAKAYTLVFFLFHFAITLYWFYKNQKITFKRAMTQYFIGGLTIFLTILPWTYALHKKYGEWSIAGHAGKLNMSWQLNSGKSFKPNIKLLIPPTYTDSPSFWEDPYPSQGKLSTPFGSTAYFIKWIVRIVHTLFVAIGCLNEISCFAFSILLFSIFFFFFRLSKEENTLHSFQIQLLILTALSLPIGYLTMHIETRYIWLDCILIMILGALLLEKFRPLLTPFIYSFMAAIMAISFIIFPFLDMKNLKNKNKDLFEYANNLNSHGIKGSFTSNAVDAGRMWVVAYLSNTSFYTIERSDYSTKELIEEMKRYNVQYYLFQSENNKPNITLDETHFKFVEKADGFDLFELR